jgi:hypothetical protein
MINEQRKILIISWIRKRYMEASDDDLIKRGGIINPKKYNNTDFVRKSLSRNNYSKTTFSLVRSYRSFNV